MQGRGEHPGTRESDVAQHVGGAGGTLGKIGPDALAKGFPVVRKAVQVQYLLTECAPQLLNGTPPWSISRQANHFQARQARQLSFDLLMLVNRPVIPDDVDRAGVGETLIDLL